MTTEPLPKNHSTTSHQQGFRTTRSQGFRRTTLEDTLLHEDPTKVNDYSTYRQRIRNAADNYDAFSKTSGGKIAARKVYTHEVDNRMTKVLVQHNTLGPTTLGSVMR